MADFITADNHLTLLSQANKLVFDKTSEVFARHPLTTDEIKICCEDTKVLGPRELKQLVKWREKMRKFLDEVGSDKEGSGEEGVEHGEGVMDRIDAKVKALENEEAAELKRYNFCDYSRNCMYYCGVCVNVCIVLCMCSCLYVADYMLQQVISIYCTSICTEYTLLYVPIAERSVGYAGKNGSSKNVW